MAPHREHHLAALKAAAKAHRVHRDTLVRAAREAIPPMLDTVLPVAAGGRAGA